MIESVKMYLVTDFLDAEICYPYQYLTSSRIEDDPSSLAEILKEVLLAAQYLNGQVVLDSLYRNIDSQELSFQPGLANETLPESTAAQE